LEGGGAAAGGGCPDHRFREAQAGTTRLVRVGRVFPGFRPEIGHLVREPIREDFRGQATLRTIV